MVFLSYGSYRSLLGQSKPLGSNQHTSIFHMAACFIICAMWMWYVMHVQSHKSMFYNVLYITLCCAHPYIHYYDSYDSYDTYDMTSANDMTLSLFLCLLRLALRKWRQSSAEQLQGLDWGVQKERKKEREREMHITYTTYTIYIIYIIYTDACQQLPTHQDTQGFRDAKRIR